MLWMCICVSLHMHLLCVGLRARLRGLCEWMFAVLCVCVSERILCVSACVCPNVWSILLRHCDWLVPTVTALTDSGGWPLTSTIPHIRLAVLFPSSQLRIVSSLHIMAFVFLSRSRIEKPPSKTKTETVIGHGLIPALPLLTLSSSILLRVHVSWALLSWEEIRHGPDEAVHACLGFTSTHTDATNTGNYCKQCNSVLNKYVINTLLT